MQTNIKNLAFKSSNETDTVSAVAIYPDETPIKAVLLISHGMVEHIGRYREFMMFLAQNGYAVLGHDHIGHGKTVLDADHLGYFAHENGYQCLIKDMHHLCLIAEKMFPGKKRFLFGHSMGSLIARLYCNKFSKNISGAVFCGTPGPNPLSSVAMALARYHIRKDGEFSRTPLLQKLTLDDMNRRFTPVRTPKDWISRNEETVDQYLADPLCQFTFTSSAFLDLFSMLELANSRKWVSSYPKELPTMMIAGDCDPVGNFGRGTMLVYNMLVSANVTDLTFQLYEGARHELLGETNREEVFQDLLEWLDARV